MNWIIRKDGYDREDVTAAENRFLCANGYLGVRGSLDEYRRDLLPAINLAGVYDQVGEKWREPVNAPNALFTAVRVGGEYLVLPEKPAQEHSEELDFRYGIYRRRTKWRLLSGTVEIESERFASLAEPHLICQRVRVRADFHADIEIETGIDTDIWEINGPHFDRFTYQGESGGELRDRNEIVDVREARHLGCVGTTHEKGSRIAVAEGYAANHAHEHREKLNIVGRIGDGTAAVVGAGTIAERRDSSENAKEMGTSSGIYHRIFRIPEIGETFTIERRIAIYTSEDQAEDLIKEQEEGRAEYLTNKLIRSTDETSYDELLAQHKAQWDRIWERAQVEIGGDPEAEQALNYSIYHLMSIAPRACASRSIPARGLSGQTYKGAVFWDTEMFMMDLFLNTFPEEAKKLIRYRIDTLPGALQKAKEYGYDGAFYAWESQEGGFDGCTNYNVVDVFTGRPMRTFFRDRQYHISAAVVYALKRYLEVTGDREILQEGGAEMIVQCARFYDSLLMCKAHSEEYQILDAIGPDEYHEHVRNNGYTNRMAKMVFETAAEVLRDLCRGSEQSARTDRSGEETEKLSGMLSEQEADELVKRFLEDAEHLVQQRPQQDGTHAGIAEQFDGYFALEDCTLDEVRSRILNPREYWGGAYGVASQTQIIKQADVVAQIALFPEEYTEAERKANWDYYEPRTEHGSSLSATMYGLLACDNGEPDKAYPFFMKSAKADLVGGGKEWAGEIYIGGTHPAAAGGAYMIATRGFAGLTVSDNQLKISPHLPSGWTSLAFTVAFRGKYYRVEVTQDGARVVELSE